MYTPGVVKDTWKNFPDAYLEAIGMFMLSSSSEYTAEIGSTQVTVSEYG